MASSFQHSFVPDDEGLFCLFCGRTAGEHLASSGYGERSLVNRGAGMKKAARQQWQALVASYFEVPETITDQMTQELTQALYKWRLAWKPTSLKIIAAGDSSTDAEGLELIAPVAALAIGNQNNLLRK